MRLIQIGIQVFFARKCNIMICTQWNLLYIRISRWYSEPYMISLYSLYTEYDAKTPNVIV